MLPVFGAGWASNNKFALLGGMRAVAQSISYEVPLVLSAMVPVILAGSLRLGTSSRCRPATTGSWCGPSSSACRPSGIFMLAMLAEANRIPFDIPEAESELVAGVTTEYTGMKFALFYMAEYIHTIVASAVGAALFLGGWDGPFSRWLHWMVPKTLLLFTVVYWVRWSLLRFRSDQLMGPVLEVPGAVAAWLLVGAPRPGWWCSREGLPRRSAVRALATSFANFCRRSTTVEFPDVIRPRAERYRDSFALLHEEDGDEACIGCLQCEKICPRRSSPSRPAESGSRRSPARSGATPTTSCST